MLSPETRPASSRRLLERRAGHQAVDALVHIAQPLLQPHDGLAVGGEAEMAGLDDAGMHRADRDLVQRRRLRPGGRRRRRRRRRGRRARRADGARPSGRGRASGASIRAALGLEAVEVADGALQAQRRRMRARRPTGSGRSGQARLTTSRSPAARRSSAMCTALAVAPQAEQRRLARPQCPRSPAASVVVIDHDARPGPMAVRRPSPLVQCRSSAGHRPLLTQQPRDALEPGDQRRRQIDAGRQHQRQMREQRHVGGLDRRRAAGRLAEGDARCRRSISAPKPTSRPNTSRIASSGSRAKVELTIRNSLMKMPSGGRPAMATTPSTRPQPSTGWLSVSPRISAMLLRALDLRDMADGEEDRRLGEAVHGHVQQAGEVGERPAHAEGEGDDAHVLDRGVGEHALDVAPPVQHEAGEDQRHEAHASPSAARARCAAGWPRAAS